MDNTFKKKEIEILPGEQVLIDEKKVKVLPNPYKRFGISGFSPYVGKSWSMMEFQKIKSLDTAIYSEEVIVTNQRIIQKRGWYTMCIIDYFDNKHPSTQKQDWKYFLSYKDDISVIVNEEGERYLQVLIHNLENESEKVPIYFFFKNQDIIPTLSNLFGEKFESEID